MDVVKELYLGEFIFRFLVLSMLALGVTLLVFSVKIVDRIW